MDGEEEGVEEGGDGFVEVVGCKEVGGQRGRRVGMNGL